MRSRIALLSFVAVLASGSVSADTYVNGYYRSDGTYVAPHYRSDPNDTLRDNWSTRGNTNPYTGERGTRDVCGYGSSEHYC